MYVSYWLLNSTICDSLVVSVFVFWYAVKLLNINTNALIISNPINKLPAIINAFDAFSIEFPPYYFAFVAVIELNDDDILVNPINTSGIIKYPTNKHTIGAKPITFPIIPFLFINLSFDSFLFAW